MEQITDSENASGYKSERRRAIVALWLSAILPVAYLVKDVCGEFDVKTLLSNGSKDDNGTSELEFIERLEPILQCSYSNVVATTELCFIILALTSIFWRPRAALLLPYVISTSAWAVSVAVYVLYHVLWKKPRPGVHATTTLLFCFAVYAIILLHGYFACIVLDLCAVLLKHQAHCSPALPANTADEGGFVEIPLPKYDELSPPKLARKPCPSVIYSDLLRKYEPYFPEVNDEEQEERIIYRRL